MSAGLRRSQSGCARPCLLALTSLLSTVLLLGACKLLGRSGASFDTEADLVTGARELNAAISQDLQNHDDLSSLSSRLLLASHNRLSWYSVKGVSVLQEGEVNLLSS